MLNPSSSQEIARVYTCRLMQLFVPFCSLIQTTSVSSSQIRPGDDER